MNKLDNQENYNCRVTTETGDEYLIYANWLHNEQLDRWKGWICEAGVTRLVIDKNLNIFSGECYHDNLGHALDGFQLKEYTICRLDRCTGGTDDLMIAKHKL